jgi:hypothetical protein
MLSFVDLETYLKGWLTEVGYDPLPYFDPGPGTDLNAIDASPGRLVLLTIGSGAGFTTEQVFDRPMVQVRTAGLQSDYSDAEKLSQDCDRAMTAVAQSQFLNGKWCLSINRLSGSPLLLLKDDADRYHFTCSYIVEIQY